jgi:hypothetical protein
MMTMAITAFLIGSASAVLVWIVAYRCGHLSGYEAGLADALDEQHSLAWAEARDFCEALVRAEEVAR